MIDYPQMFMLGSFILLHFWYVILFPLLISVYYGYSLHKKHNSLRKALLSLVLPFCVSIVILLVGIIFYKTDSHLAILFNWCLLGIQMVYSFVVGFKMKGYRTFLFFAYLSLLFISIFATLISGTLIYIYDM